MRSDYLNHQGYQNYPNHQNYPHHQNYQNYEQRIDPIIAKILNAMPNVFVIFFAYGCQYCNAALQLLREMNLNYKGYDISKIPGGLPTLLSIFRNNANTINYDVNHQTKPIIFLNGQFIGGYRELSNIVGNNYYHQ